MIFPANNHIAVEGEYHASPARVASALHKMGLRDAKPESLERQIRRIENNPEISATVCFHPFALTIVVWETTSCIPDYRSDITGRSDLYGECCHLVSWSGFASSLDNLGSQHAFDWQTVLGTD